MNAGSHDAVGLGGAGAAAAGAAWAWLNCVVGFLIVGTVWAYVDGLATRRGHYGYNERTAAGVTAVPTFWGGVSTFRPT
jgi:hypothetical protein